MFEFTKVEKHAVNHGDTKEMIMALSILDCTSKKEVVVARWYMGRSRNASRVYCSIWLQNIGENRSGTAWASGYGYDKREASGYAALRAAGIRTKDGQAIECALEALAKHYGFENTMVIRHG